IGRLADPPVPSSVVLPGPALRTTARLAVTAAGRAGHRRRGDADGDLAVATEACQAVHPLLEELIVEGRYRPGEVLLRGGVASGARLVQVAAGAGPADVEVPGDVVVVEEGGGPDACIHEEVAGRG